MSEIGDMGGWGAEGGKVDTCAVGIWILTIISLLFFLQQLVVFLWHHALNNLAAS